MKHEVKPVNAATEAVIKPALSAQETTKYIDAIVEAARKVNPTSDQLYGAGTTVSVIFDTMNSVPDVIDVVTKQLSKFEGARTSQELQGIKSNPSAFGKIMSELVTAKAMPKNILDKLGKDAASKLKSAKNNGELYDVFEDLSIEEVLEYMTIFRMTMQVLASKVAKGDKLVNSIANESMTASLAQAIMIGGKLIPAGESLSFDAEGNTSYNGISFSVYDVPSSAFEAKMAGPTADEYKAAVLAMRDFKGAAKLSMQATIAIIDELYDKSSKAVRDWLEANIPAQLSDKDKLTDANLKKLSSLDKHRYEQATAALFDKYVNASGDETQELASLESAGITLAKAIKVDGKTVPAGTVLKPNEAGYAAFESTIIDINRIPAVALEGVDRTEDQLKFLADFDSAIKVLKDKTGFERLNDRAKGILMSCFACTDTKLAEAANGIMDYSKDIVKGVNLPSYCRYEGVVKPGKAMTSALLKSWYSDEPEAYEEAIAETVALRKELDRGSAKDLDMTVGTYFQY